MAPEEMSALRGPCAYSPFSSSGSSHLHRKCPITCAPTETKKLMRYSIAIHLLPAAGVMEGQHSKYNIASDAIQQKEPVSKEFRETGPFLLQFILSED